MHGCVLHSLANEHALHQQEAVAVVQQQIGKDLQYLGLYRCSWVAAGVGFLAACLPELGFPSGLCLFRAVFLTAL